MSGVDGVYEYIFDCVHKTRDVHNALMYHSFHLVPFVRVKLTDVEENTMKKRGISDVERIKRA